MKVLYYNWVQFDDWKLRGGGVSVYLKNTIGALLKINPEIEVYFLSSGQHYTLLNRERIFIKKTNNIFESAGVKSFRIFNSPVKAPAHDMFCSLNSAMESLALKNVLKDFLQTYGPFDIVHLHNIEGLTMDVFSLKEDFPETKFYLTAHNYHIICPQIELFQHRKKICKDYQSGHRCVGCIGHYPNVVSLKKWQALGSFIELQKIEQKPLGNFVWDLSVNSWNIWKSIKKISFAIRNILTVRHIRASNNETIIEALPKVCNLPTINPDAATPYLFWRQHNVKTINKYIDGIIAVSEQTRDILVQYGLREDKTYVLHNGLDFYNSKKDALKLWKYKKEAPFRLGFFGYPIPSKGLDLFLTALEKMDDDVLQNVELFVASRLDENYRNRLEKLNERLKQVFIVNGYKRKDAPALMSTITLGVVPSVWQETFCQAGAEMISFGTPVLVSDTVGIKSLIHNSDFVFMSASEEDLKQKLLNLISNREVLDTFWETVEMPMSATEHAAKLLEIYG